MGLLKSTLKDSFRDGCCVRHPFPLEGLPEEVFVHVLSFVPARDVIRSCRLVSREWRLVADSQSLWRLKCLRDGVAVPRLPLSTSSPTSPTLQNSSHRRPSKFVPDYRRLYVLNPYGRNLLKNWNARDGLLHWAIYANTGDRFSVEEEIPPGAQPLASIIDEDVCMCWATSFGWCCKGQMIDLIGSGCHEEVLDELQPVLYISVWTTARVDCASFYIVEVNLLSQDRQVLHTFTYEHRVDQPAQHAGRWVKITHTFDDYGPGVRFVDFKHGGMDTQYWAGHYGPKMAAPCVQFDLSNTLENR